MRIMAPLACALLAACGGGGGDGGGGGGGATVSFALDILPIFQQECTTCHGGAGGLDLESHAGVLAGGVSGPAVMPGDPADSLLPKRLEGTIQPQMPLNGTPLSQTEIDAIRQWILEGALNN